MNRRVDIVNELFGQRIADPCRWLEADPCSDAEVAAWVSVTSSRKVLLDSVWLAG
jgi:hypothetical protein